MHEYFSINKFDFKDEGVAKNILSMSTSSMEGKNIIFFFNYISTNKGDNSRGELLHQLGSIPLVIFNHYHKSFINEDKIERFKVEGKYFLSTSKYLMDDVVGSWCFS